MIAGVMPSWDNTARRRRAAHIAHGANPLRFEKWLRGLAARRLAGSYRQELFVNAWNEWAEKAVLEPSAQYGRAALDALAGGQRRGAPRCRRMTRHPRRHPQDRRPPPIQDTLGAEPRTVSAGAGWSIPAIGRAAGHHLPRHRVAIDHARSATATTRPAREALAPRSPPAMPAAPRR